MNERRSLLVLGSNLGNRMRHLRRAAAQLNRLPGTKVLRRSRIYETSPIGPARRPFLNMAVELSTPLSPMGLLIELKRLEAQAGREPGPRWSNRPLDIDIAAYALRRVRTAHAPGKAQYLRAPARTAWLTIPHPRLTKRSFALVPLAELSPSWKPDGKRSATAWLRSLKPRPGSVKIYRAAHG